MATPEKDQGYIEQDYVPVRHEYLGWTIIELTERDTQWDCVDPSGRMTYHPHQRQYVLLQPNGDQLLADDGEQPVVVCHYGAALEVVHRTMAEQQHVLRELVTGPSATEPSYSNAN